MKNFVRSGFLIAFIILSGSANTIGAEGSGQIIPSHTAIQISSIIRSERVNQTRPTLPASSESITGQPGSNGDMRNLVNQEPESDWRVRCVSCLDRSAPAFGVVSVMGFIGVVIYVIVVRMPHQMHS